MKPIIIIATTMAALLALSAGCAKTEVISEKGTGSIFFRTRVGNATKAITEITGSNILSGGNDVYVYAQHGARGRYFKDDGYLALSGLFSNGFYQTDYGWPDSSTVYFYAFNVPNGTSDFSTANSFNRSSYNTVTVKDTVATDMIDLVYAFNTGNKEANMNSGVLLNFRHALSQLEVQVQNTASITRYEIMGYKIVRIADRGTFTGAAASTSSAFASDVSSIGEWSDVSGEGTYVSINASGQAIIATSTYQTIGQNMLIIPQKVTANTSTATENDFATGTTPYFAIFHRLYSDTDNSLIAPTEETKRGLYDAAGNLAENGKYVCSCLPLNITFEPGYKYTIYLNLTGGGYHEYDPDEENPKPGFDPIRESAIKFDIKVDAWQSESATPASEGEWTMTQ